MAYSVACAAAIALLCSISNAHALECGPKPSEFRSIAQIQGNRHSSPLEGEQVVTEGVITAVIGTKSFIIQTPDDEHDDDLLTSEALTVYHRDADVQDTLAVGDLVRAAGTVTEFGYQDSLEGTQVLIDQNSASENIAVCQKGVKLPSPVVVGRDAKPPTVSAYQGSIDLSTCEGDDCPELKPTVNGMDFWETLENMRVVVKDPLVVQGTNKYSEFVVVPNRGLDSAPNINGRRGITADPAAGDWNPERVKVRAPSGTTPFNIGDEITSLEGTVGYNYGQFALRLSKTPEKVKSQAQGVILEGATQLRPKAGELTIGSYNVENFPGNLESSKNDPAAKAAAIARHLVTVMQAPAIVALQELQDNSGDGGRKGQRDGIVDGTESAARLIAAITAAGGPQYMFSEIAPQDGKDGGIPGGNIRVAYLYDPARAVLATAGEARKGSASEDVAVLSIDGRTQLSVNPGRVSPESFARSRKPLAAHFIHLSTGHHYFIVNAHLSSKGGSTALMGPLQPPKNGGEANRLRQAAAIREFVEHLLCADPAANVVVLGDMNEFDSYPAMQELQKGGVLEDLLHLKLPQVERYTYIFRGNAQALDHMYVSRSLRSKSELDVLHVNTGVEVALETSDHDPLLAILRPAAITASRTPCSECGAGEFCEDCSCTAGSLPTLPDPVPEGTVPVMPKPTPDPAAPPSKAPPRTPGSSGAVWINEIHYENVGPDEGEFVEVVGLSETNVEGWKVLLYNGRNGKLYATADLPALDDVDGVEGGLGFAVVDDFKSGIQNGAADAIALVDADSKLVEFLSYEGTVTATDGPAKGAVSTDIGVRQSGRTPRGRSLGLGGVGSRKADFEWRQMRASPGALNEGQSVTGALRGECGASRESC